MTQDAAASRPFALSLTGFLIGAGAFLLVVVQYVVGPFAPQDSATLGEIAGSLARDAVDSFMRKEPSDDVTVSAWDIDRIMLAAAMVAAVIAIILGAVGLIRHESPRAVGAALAMGAVAIAFQFVASTLMLIIGALIIIALFAMLGEFFGGFFGGL